MSLSRRSTRTPSQRRCPEPAPGSSWTCQSPTASSSKQRAGFDLTTLPGEEFPRQLREGKVYIWRIGLAAAPGAMESARRLLSFAELARADRYRAVRAARNFTLTRAALRRLLGICLEIPPEEVDFTHSREGKIMLAGAPAPAWQFNVAHSRDLALIAVALGSEVGVDVEFCGRQADLDSVAGAAFSDSELARWHAVPGSERVREFYRMWTLKEAFIKATGHGLSRDLKNFSVTPASVAGGPRLESIEGDPEAGRSWTLLSLRPHTDYAAGVAFHCPGAAAELLDYPAG